VPCTPLCASGEGGMNFKRWGDPMYAIVVPKKGLSRIAMRNMYHLGVHCHRNCIIWVYIATAGVCRNTVITYVFRLNHDRRLHNNSHNCFVRGVFWFVFCLKLLQTSIEVFILCCMHIYVSICIKNYMHWCNGGKLSCGKRGQGWKSGVWTCEVSLIE